jgi:ABC-type amino acid transport substrate-binding protein
VCADPSNPPYASNDAATPGFEVELARLVARELGVEARFAWHPTFVRALRPLRDGACDLFMGLPRDARFREGNPWIAVSRPYYTMQHAIVTRSDGRPLGLGDLAGTRVAVELAGMAEVFLAYRDVPRGLYRTQAQAFRAVMAGEAPAALIWLPVASWLARGHADARIVPVSDASLDFPVGAGVRRRERGLAEAVDAAIARLLDTGEAQAVLARYGAISRAASRRGDDVVLAQAKDAGETGRSLFSTACSRCHGADGVGGGAGGAVPALKHYAGGFDRFVRVTMQGRKNTPMGGFKGILSEDEVASIYRYLTSIPRQ